MSDFEVLRLKKVGRISSEVEVHVLMGVVIHDSFVAICYASEDGVRRCVYAKFFGARALLQVWGVQVAMALLASFNEACRFIRAQMKGPVIDQSLIDESKQVQIENLSSLINNSSIGLDEATQFLEALGAPSPFEASEIAKLSSHMQRKCVASGTIHTGLDVQQKGKMQNHMYMYNYFSKDDWEHLRSEASNIDNRISVVVDRCLTIGLFFPTEKTYSSLLSIIAVAGRELWDAETSYAHLQNLKTRFKSQRKAKIEIEGRGKRIIDKFPVSFVDFRSIVDDVEYDAVLPPVSVSLIEQRRSIMATRRSHKAVRESGQEQQLAIAGSPVALLMQQLLGLQQQAQHPNRLSHGRQPLQLTFPRQERSTPSPAGSVGAATTLTADSLSLGESDIELYDDPQRQVAAAPGAAAPAAALLSLPPPPPRTSSIGTPKSIIDTPSPAPPAAASESDDRKSRAKRDLTALADELDKALAAKSELRAEGVLPALKRPRLRKKTKVTSSIADLGRPKKTKAKKAGKPKAKAKAKAKAMVVPVAGADRTAEPPPAMPPIDTRNRLSYLGCRIYTVPEHNRWRVVPMPGVSRYDKGFAWLTRTPAEAWESLIAYCQNPTLPEKRTGEF